MGSSCLGRAALVACSPAPAREGGSPVVLPDGAPAPAVPMLNSIADGAAFGEDRGPTGGALIAPAVEVALSKQLSQAQISGFLSDLSGGMAHARALARAGMPWGAFNRRMQSDPEFREAYTAAITIRDHRLKAESVDRMIHLGLRGVVRNVVQGNSWDTQEPASRPRDCNKNFSRRRQGVISPRARCRRPTRRRHRC